MDKLDERNKYYELLDIDWLTQESIRFLDILINSEDDESLDLLKKISRLPISWNLLWKNYFNIVSQKSWTQWEKIQQFIAMYKDSEEKWGLQKIDIQENYDFLLHVDGLSEDWRWFLSALVKNSQHPPIKEALDYFTTQPREWNWMWKISLNTAWESGAKKIQNGESFSLTELAQRVVRNTIELNKSAQDF